MNISSRNSSFQERRGEQISTRPACCCGFSLKTCGARGRHSALSFEWHGSAAVSRTVGALLPHGYRNCRKSKHYRTAEQKKERGLSRCPELGEIKARSWPDTEAIVRDLVLLKRCEGVGLRVSIVIHSHGGSGKLRLGALLGHLT